MKKILLPLIVCFFYAIYSPLPAQECKLCGDWVGTYPGSQKNKNTGEMDDGIYKEYIRIKKYGQEYKIWFKTEFPLHNYVRHDYDECTILRVDEESIYFKRTSPIERSGKGYFQTIEYCKITYRNGYIHYKLEAFTLIDYDMNRRIIRQEDDAIKYRAKSKCDDLDLFKEEDIW